MTTNQAIHICKEHSIGTRLVGGQLQIEEVYCESGEAYSNWIPCPASYRDLMFWLGY